MSSVLSDLRKTMDSFDLIPENLDLLSDSLPSTPLVFLPDPDHKSDQQTLKLVLDLIVQYNTHRYFVDHHLI